MKVGTHGKSILKLTMTVHKNEKGSAKMKLYIAGPITGCKDYRTKFLLAQTALEAERHTAINPAALPDGLEYEEYMTIGLAMLSCCDGVFLLQGWRESKGAIREFNAAVEAGKILTGDVTSADILNIAHCTSLGTPCAEATL